MTGAADDSARTTRRRGAELEAALLEAAWAELAEVGYPALTMEAVAARAGTGRAVLYRRWPSRTELALAALRHRQSQSGEFTVPDTGSVREDLLALLRHMSSRLGEIIAALSFVFTDCYRETGQSPAIVRERFIGGAPSALPPILERAVQRGEIDPAKLTPRITRLPADLVRHDLIMSLEPVPEATLVQIVDEIFLPLVRPSGS
jgi:AcrR family transcriptional regulator